MRPIRRTRIHRRWIWPRAASGVMIMADERQGAALRATRHLDTVTRVRGGGREAQPPEGRRLIFDPSHTSGSYLRSTARSFSGIRALSVILMSSGHTSVQHLVMLQ